MLAVKSISFTEEYSKELEYFITQPNKSRYICELIRNDMKKGNSIISREQIIAIIEEKIKELPTAQGEGDNEEIRNNLVGLFGDV